MNKPAIHKETFKDKKYIVGVTGGIGCGKTTVTNLFAAKGICIVDADIVAREVVVAGSEGLNALVIAFGDTILSVNKTLNRGVLREIVFADSKAKDKVNGILHPLIRQTMLNQLQNTQSQYCILSAPLLFENNLQQFVDRCLVVDITQSQQLERTLSRDGGNANIIKSIMAAQVSREKRLSLANDVVDNSKAQCFLTQQVDSLHNKYAMLAAQLTT